MLTHFSLFSGIGGIDLAAEWAGFTTVGQCEWADYPTKVLEKHWPDVPRWRDIRDVTAESVMARKVGAITLVSGGFPCQPFSTAGRRQGTEDDRYLWPEMLRVVSELRPTWVIGENVAGLASMVLEYLPIKVESRTITRSPDYDIYEAILTRQEIMLLDAVCKNLESKNYQVQPFIIPACAVNAPHKRDRVWIVAWNSESNDIGKVGRIQKRQNTYTRGIRENVAHSECIKNIKRYNGYIQWRRPREAKQTWMGGCNVSHSYSQGLPQRNEPRGIREAHGGVEPGSESKRIHAAYGWQQWATEPDVGRVANGVSYRVDRLKCLGNAVVPYQVYPILQTIADIENGIV